MNGQAQKQQIDASATVSRHFPELGEVTVTRLPAMKAQLLWVRLFRIIGPTMGKAIEGLEGKEVDDLLSMADGKIAGVSSVGGAITVLVDRLTVEEFDAIRKQLLAGVLVDGQPIERTADLVFQGKTFALFKVLAFALEANFSDFFGGLGAVVAKFRARKQRSSGTSPTTSPQPGPVGD